MPGDVDFGRSGHNYVKGCHPNQPFFCINEPLQKIIGKFCATYVAETRFFCSV